MPRRESCDCLHRIVQIAVLEHAAILAPVVSQAVLNTLGHSAQGGAQALSLLALATNGVKNVPDSV